MQPSNGRPPIEDEDEGSRKRNRNEENAVATNGAKRKSRALLLLTLAGGAITVLALSLGAFLLTRSQKTDSAGTVATGGNATPQSTGTSEASPPERGRDPAPRFARDEVVKLLIGAGFAVSDSGGMSQGQTVDGEISLSSFEVDCEHRASKGNLKLKTSSQTFNKTGQTTNAMVLSGDRSPAVEAAFKAFAEQFHKNCTDAYTQALKATNDGGGEKGKSIGSLKIVATKDRIAFEFAVRSSAPDPNPAMPTSLLPIDPAKLIGKWSIGERATTEFTKDGKVTIVATSDGMKINLAGTYKLDGRKMIINLKVTDSEIKRTELTILKLSDDELEYMEEDGEKTTLKKLNSK